MSSIRELSKCQWCNDDSDYSIKEDFNSSSVNICTLNWKFSTGGQKTGLCDVSCSLTEQVYTATVCSFTKFEPIRIVCLYLSKFSQERRRHHLGWNIWMVCSWLSLGTLLREDIQKKKLQKEWNWYYLSYPSPLYWESKIQKNEILKCLRPPSPLLRVINLVGFKVYCNTFVGTFQCSEISLTSSESEQAW